MFSLLRPIPKAWGEQRRYLVSRSSRECEKPPPRVEQVLRFPGADRCSLVTALNGEEKNGEKRRIKRERKERRNENNVCVCVCVYTHVCARGTGSTRVYTAHKHQRVRALIASSELVGINWSGQLTLTAWNASRAMKAHDWSASPSPPPPFDARYPSAPSELPANPLINFAILRRKSDPTFRVDWESTPDVTSIDRYRPVRSLEDRFVGKWF